MTTPPRRHVAAAAVLGGAEAALVSFAVHASFATPKWQPAFGLVVFASMMAFAVPALRRQHHFASVGPANGVTMLRAALVSSVAGMVWAPATAPVAWLIVLIASIVIALDGVDGWVARRTGMSSDFGARFDMEVDAFFLLVLSTLIWRHERAGAWVLAIGSMRYAFVAARWWLPWMRGHLTPTWRGKAVAVVQMVALSVGMLPFVPAAVSRPICAAALVTLIWSFSVDVRRLHQAARVGDIGRAQVAPP